MTETMKRHQLGFLQHWAQSKTRKPLVIRGARQVGKSTLVRLFAEQSNRNLIEVNLERYPQLGEVFASNDPHYILQQIEALPRMASVDENSLLFLDEIQAAPAAISALRYFYEERPELPLICAGSLLEFALSDRRFSMPVGRIRYLPMGPMTFSEFLQALDEKKLAHIVNTYMPGDLIGPIVHQRLRRLLHEYCFVGGMPEAVAAYAEQRRLGPVSETHTSIIETYRDDFPKYIGNRDRNRILNVFNIAARSVGTKVKYSHFSRDDQSATIKRDLELLCMARVVNKVIHSHCTGLPLQSTLKENVYKLLFLDVGLMNTICDLNWRAFSQLNETQGVNDGPVAEQFVGQHLQALLTDSPNRELTYWLREGRSYNAELDFVVALEGQIIPIEVKAGATGSLKSLHQFMGEKQLPLAVRFDASLPSVHSTEATIKSGNQSQRARYTLASLPLYLVERLPDVVRCLLD